MRRFTAFALLLFASLSSETLWAQDGFPSTPGRHRIEVRSSADGSMLSGSVMHVGNVRRAVHRHRLRGVGARLPRHVVGKALDVPGHPGRVHRWDHAGGNASLRLGVPPNAPP